MTCTRPDICFTVTYLSRYLSCPTTDQLNAIKHVLRYLKGTLEHKLCYRKCADSKINGFCDADWASDPHDRQSITGYCFSVSDGPLISWKSTKQRVVALSTCEAEYIALAAAAQEANFLNQLMKCIDGNVIPPVVLRGDNQASLSLARNPNNHKRTKHIDIKYHFIRHEYNRNNIVLIYTPTNENVADIFTKPVTKAKLSSFLLQIFGEK